jgi:hypothetical protein
MGALNGTHQGAVHPTVLASGFDTSGAYWAPMPDKAKRKVFVVMGAFGDIYMIAKHVPPGSIIATSPHYADIVYELFPDLEVFEVEGDRNSLPNVAAMCAYKYPTYDIIVAQQDGQGTDVVKPYRSYQKFQEAMARS